MENLINPFRKDNFVKYFGPLSHDFKTFGQLIEINNENDFIKLKISTLFEQEVTEIYASLNEIRGVYTTPKMLFDLGFNFDEQTKYFEKDDKRLVHIRYVKPATNLYGHPDGLMLIDRGFRLIIDSDFDISNEDEAMSKTIDLNSLHMIQNYWKIILGLDLETKNLEPLWRY